MGNNNNNELLASAAKLIVGAVLVSAGTVLGKKGTKELGQKMLKGKTSSGKQR